MIILKISILMKLNPHETSLLPSDEISTMSDEKILFLLEVSRAFKMFSISFIFLLQKGK